MEDYTNIMSKYSIICYIHGVFKTTMDNHINKKVGCPRCVGKGFNIEDKMKSLTHLKYIKHDKDKIHVECVKCNHIYSKTYTNHTKQKCPKCSIKGRKNLTLEEIQHKLSKLKTNYHYVLESYTSYSKPFIIICPKHGEFKQSLQNHFQGQRCPKCKTSKGENKIINFLNKNNIDYIHQHTFNDCLNPNTFHKLIFDFFIPSLNLCIEYDGELHYKAVTHFGGINTLNDIQFKDKVKDDYCINNNITLIRIPFTQIKKINEILYETIQISNIT